MALLDFDTYIKQIERRLQEPDRALASNPVIEKIRQRELSRTQLAGWANQIYIQTREIVRWLGALYANCPIPKFRREIFLNLYEEEMGGTTKTDAHPELMARVGLAFGLKREEMDTARVLPATAQVIRLGELYLAHRHWVVGMGCAMGFEYQSPVAFKFIADGLRKSYGLTDDEVLFFDVHVTADEDHSGSILRALHEHATTEELQQEAMEAAWTYAGAYYQMLSTYEAFA